MDNRALWAAIAAIGCGVLMDEARAQADWDVVVNGRAVHMNAAADWNEENWGLGIEREFDTQSRWIKVAVANGFKDSLGEPSYMAGGGVKRRFRVVSDDFYVDLGVVGFLMTREDVNDNQPFPGLLPAMTVGSKRVALNFTYLPGSVVDRVTSSRLRDPELDGVLFIQLKLDSSLFGFGGRRRDLFASAESN